MGRDRPDRKRNVEPRVLVLNRWFCRCERFALRNMEPPCHRRFTIETILKTAHRIFSDSSHLLTIILMLVYCVKPFLKNRNCTREYRGEKNQHLGGTWGRRASQGASLIELPDPTCSKIHFSLRWFSVHFVNTTAHPCPNTHCTLRA